ncbi:MAG: beta-L-arabinofuranosidase domain-containing protein, partial [Planctomycetota bacterium]
DHKMAGEGLLWYKGAWPYEGGGYWFDGLARLGYALHDEALIAQAKGRLYAVADHMNTDGLLFLWWLDRNNPDDRKAVTAALEGWPLWACGLLGRAMTGFYAGSGDKHVLEALEKAYTGDSDCLRSIPGNMSNPWPAFDTFCWTGNQDIAAALDAMFKQEDAGLLPSLSRYRKAPDLNPGSTVDNAHVVEFIESTTPWAVGYLWTGDRRYLQAAVGWHDLLERVAMQPHGVPVSDEWYGPTGAFRGSETCDVAGYVWSQICLLFVSGEGRMADRAERAFFNAGPATVSRDFKTHVYFQSPNRFANLSPNFPHGPRAGGGTYQRKHSPLCCTAALNRIVPWYVTHMWMATYDNGLAATCYGPCKVTALVANRVPVVITCKTDYPWLPLLPAAKRKSPERVTLIPYGCTKFRISMFPVTAEPETKASAIRRILFLGNSITLHGPKADIGWTGNWGMAASSEDKDYVHLVTSALAQHTGSRPQIMVRNIADFERNYATYDVDSQMKDLFAFDPDLVVLAIGENVPALGSEDAKAQFKAGVMNILSIALAKRHPLVVVRSCFWADAAKDEVLSQACQEADGIFVNAGPLGRDAANAARSERSFTHDGVAGHPGDKGMKALADAIVKAVLNFQTEKH